MKVADEMYVEWVEGEAVVLNRESGELHYLNGPAALVFALIQEHGYERGIAEAAERFDLDPNEGDLSTLLGDLTDSGILTDGASAPVEAARSTRAEPRADAG